VPFKIGSFLDNARRPAAKLYAERRSELAALCLAWAVLKGGT
jgi:hypothetical protein